MIKPSQIRRNGHRGYTLVELMIVVTILGIISSIAYPHFVEFVQETRRTDAREALEEIRTLEYEFFQNYKRYGTRDEINYASTSTKGYYQIGVVANALNFSASATALGPQLKDTECRVFGINTNGTLVSFDKDGAQTFNCW